MEYKRYRSDRFDEDADYLRQYPNEIIEMYIGDVTEGYYRQAMFFKFNKDEREYLDFLGPDETGQWYRIRYNDPKATIDNNKEAARLLRRD